MEVSIIVINYNKDIYLRESIDSSIRNLVNDSEILIVDDGSTDDSIKIINSYSRNDSIRIILKENEGVIKTRNRAIKEARGKYIIQLDGDDIMEDNFVQKALLSIKESDNIGIVYGQTSFCGSKSGIWDLGIFSLQKQLYTNQIVITALFKKEDFFAAKRYDEAFKEGYEDWDLWLSIIELGKEVKQLQEPALKYRILSGSRNHTITSEVQEELRRKIYKKHYILYLNNFEDPINLFWNNLFLTDKLKEIKYYKNSLEYRLGQMLLFLPKMVKRFFSKKEESTSSKTYQLKILIGLK
jgi:glycosyltransferase involved in cell wall biosynthesis